LWRNYVHSNDFKSYFYNPYSANFNYIGPICFKYERPLSLNFGYGALVGFDQVNLVMLDSGSTSLYKVNFKIKSISVAARVNYHFKTKKDVFDPFIGVGLGINASFIRYSVEERKFANSIYVSIPPSAFGNKLELNKPYFVSATLGLRIYFLKQLGLNIEAGWEKSALLCAGLVYKVKK
jgi:hypothetical protein